MDGGYIRLTAAEGDGAMAQLAGSPGRWKWAVAATGTAFLLALLQAFHSRDVARAASQTAAQALQAAEQVAAQAAGPGAGFDPYAAAGGAYAPSVPHAFSGPS
jgi:hypothetical protein